MLFPYPYTDLYNLNLDWMIKAIKEMQAIVEPLSIIVNTFNGRHGDVQLTLDDVNAVMVDVLWISSPGDTIDDLPQASLDSLYRIGRRIMIFINNANVPDTIYFLKWSSGHARPQLYSPTAALAGVASFNGRTGNVTATGSDLATSGTDSTSIAATLDAQSQQIADLNTTEGKIKSGLAKISNGDTHSAITESEYVYIQNHANLAEGLYIANENIAADAALNGKVTATSQALNVIKYNTRILDRSITFIPQITQLVNRSFLIGNGVKVIQMTFHVTEEIPINTIFATLPSDFQTSSIVASFVLDTNTTATDGMYPAYLNGNGIRNRKIIPIGYYAMSAIYR